MFTIGEFSKLNHVSARMLRHYDAIGLLRPAHVGAENGYRYYDAAQLSVLMQIETLRGFGFSLSETAGLLPLAPQELAKRIHMQRLEAHRELNALRRTIRKMEDAILKMEGTGMSYEKYQIIVMEVPEQRVFGLRRTISVDQTHSLFEDLHREMERRGLKRTGPTQLLYHGREFSYESMDVEAQAAVSGDGPDVQILPACQCAAATHTGPYETVKYAYDALSKWFAQHPEYEICGPAMERYLKDEEMANNPEELETGILFPLRKVDVK